jgi:transcriptional regulator with XRE-family HTH domain
VTAEEIKSLRRELSCSAKELAAALGLEQATVLGWERGELFPTRQYVEAMGALREKGPAAIPRKAKGKQGEPPIKVLADPQLWVLVRKLVAHKPLRDEVKKLAEGYSDPADD